MKLQTIAAISLPLFLVPIANAADDDSITLKSQIASGKKYTLRQDVTATMQTPLGGNAETKTKMSYDTTMAVKDQKGTKNKVLTMSLDGFKMEMDMAGQKMEYDSSDPNKQNPLLKGMFSGMADKKFEAIIDEEGNVLEVKEEGKTGSAAGGVMGMGFGKDEIKQMVTSVIDHGFPTKAIRPGDTWKHSIDSSMGKMGGLKMSLDYKHGGTAELDGKKYPKLIVSGGKAEGGDPAAAGGIVDFKKADMKGVVLFDNKLGVARYSEMQMDMTMSAGGAELPMKSKMVSKLVKVEDVK